MRESQARLSHVCRQNDLSPAQGDVEGRHVQVIVQSVEQLVDLLLSGAEDKNVASIATSTLGECVILEHHVDDMGGGIIDPVNGTFDEMVLADGLGLSRKLDKLRLELAKVLHEGAVPTCCRHEQDFEILPASKDLPSVPNCICAVPTACK